MNAGRVSYRTEVDGRRYIETTELIRAYGELKQGGTPKRDSPGLCGDTETATILGDNPTSAALSQAVSAMVLEMRALRDEVKELRGVLMQTQLLEHKPESEPESEPESRRRPWWRLR